MRQQNPKELSIHRSKFTLNNRRATTLDNKKQVNESNPSRDIIVHEVEDNSLISKDLETGDVTA